MSPEAALNNPAAGRPRPSRAAAAPVRYGLAVAAAGAALAACFLLRPVLAPNYFPVFLAAVALAAWRGGLGPGLVCGALSVAGSAYFLLAPVRSLGVDAWTDLAKLAVFAAVAWLVSSLSERLRSARAEAEERAQEATRLALQLQEQAVELESQAEEMQALNEELEEQVEAAATLRGELEAAVRDAEAARARLSAIIDTAAEGVVVIDRDWRVTLANPAAERVLRVSAGGTAGQRYLDLPLRRFRLDGSPLRPEDGPVSRVFASGEAVHGWAHRVEYPDGERATVRVNAAPLRGADGEIREVVASFEDVTEERRALDALRTSEERFRTLADSAPVLIWVAGTDGLRHFFNRPWLEFTGRTVEQEAGNGWAAGVHPDDRDRCMDVYLSALRERRPFRMEYRLRRADGEYRWLLDHGVPLLTPEGELTGFTGSCIDVHDRRLEAEREHFLLRAGAVLGASLDPERTLAELTRLLVPVLADYCSIDVVAPDGEIRRVETAHADPDKERLLREVWTRYPYRSDGGQGTPLVVRTREPVLIPEVSPEATAAFARDREHLEMLRALGPRSYLCVPLVARDRVVGALSMVMSDSGRRYAPADLQLAVEVARRAAVAIDNARLYADAVEANQAKSDFMAVMSHELRTPLNAVIGYTDLFLAGIPVPLPAPLRPQVERIQTAARHLLRLIEEILTFSRIEAGREEVHLAPADASAIAQAAAALVEPLALERGLGFRVEVPEPGPALVTDSGRVQQVLVNLLGNAVKFTAAGEVSLRLAEEDGAVVFTVHDTGVGIEPEQLERIFDPFWQVDQSISRRTGGTGLGLSVARQLARLLGGEVAVESVPGDGSVFTLRLPREPARGVAAPQAADAGAAR
ncbi:MAG TPA: PAS domain S-box protein [Longimicrobiaceae bacterium]|nr:PAS domain S-box protein [Longimicrobiaceae bacterium]